ncbi:MAG: hypothetical protein AAGF51_12975 [Pseudomonadota bacterium]
MLSRHLGFATSLALHLGFVLLLLFGGPLFTPDEDDPLQIVDAQFISAEEFDELVRGPTPDPQTDVLESLAPPTPPEPEAPREPESPEAPPVEAPYEAAPDAPSPLIFEQEAPPDEAAELDIPAPPQMAIAPAPPELRPTVRDEAPTPDEPDTPPAPEVAETPEPETPPEEEPEPQDLAEAEIAPKVAPRPNQSRRPRQIAEAERPETEPEQPERQPDPEPEEQPEEEQQAEPQPQQRQQAERRRAPVVGPPLSRFERDGFQLALRRCWNPPDAGGADPGSLSVRLYLEMARDGRVIGKPKLLSPQPPLSTRQQAAIRAAAVAVQRCQPFRLPPGKYGYWQEIRVTFDPLQGVLTQ